MRNRDSVGLTKSVRGTSLGLIYVKSSLILILKNVKNELNMNFIECTEFTFGKQFTSLWLQYK